MFAVILLHDRDLLARQRGNPAQNLFVGAAFLEKRNQVLHTRAMSGQLQPATDVDESNFFFHPSASCRRNYLRVLKIAASFPASYHCGAPMTSNDCGKK